jgi:chromosome segregation ATPase
MTNLQNENVQLRQQLDAIQNDSEQMRQEIQSHQNTIDNYENQLRALTEERNALRNNLNATGDVGAQHATEIQNLTRGFESQIEEKNAQIQTLQNEITGKDIEIARLTRELESTNNQLEQLNLQTTQNDVRLAELQSRNQELEIENADLTHIITEATTAIRSAIERMREFNNPNAFNETGKDNILRTINESIENINNIISGAPNQGSPPPMQASFRNITKPPLPTFEITDKNGNKIQYQTSQIIKQLEEKIDNPNIKNNSKYKLALKEINDGADIVTTLQKYVTFKNNIISGGKTKKRRKYKKQRGGFTYKHNAKRKTFSTTLNIAKGNSKKTSKRFKK